MGNAGVGKTYGITKFVINRFIKTGERFVYVRRYKPEMSKAAPFFFDKVAKEFPGYDLKLKKNQFFINGQLAGYCIVLSTAQQLKSVNYINVKWGIFDEFIIEKSFSKYIPNEVEIFLGLIETVSRLDDMRFFLLANSVTINNPYFVYFKLDLPYNTDIKLYKDGLLLLQYMCNEDYRTLKKQTKFGRLVAGTNYERYAVFNKFTTVDDSFIEKKSATSKFAFTLLYQNNYLGVWLDWSSNKFYISNDYFKDGFLYSCTLDDQHPNTIFVKMAKRSYSFRLLLEAFQNSLVYYENKKIKELSLDIFRLLI